jgi:hypothetical protein
MGKHSYSQRKTSPLVSPALVNRPPETGTATPELRGETKSAQSGDREMPLGDTERPEQPAAPGYGHDFARVRIFPDSAAPAAALMVQRDTTGLPPVPDVTLTPPSLVQTPPPTFAPTPDPSMHLTFDPVGEAAAHHVDQALAPTNVKSALANLRLGAPPPASPPANPLTSPSPTPPGGAAMPAGAGPDTPHAAGAGDIMDAVLAVPAVDAAISDLRMRAIDRVRTDWGRMQTGERAALVTVGAVIGMGALTGVASDPGARQILLDQLNGKMLPVPGVDWLHVEIGTKPDNLMVGLHVDVGALLPSSLGFGPSSPSAIGGPPPTADPLAPTQRSVQRRADGGVLSGDGPSRDWPVAAPESSRRPGFDFGSIATYPPAVQRAAAGAGATSLGGPGEDDLARRIQAASATGSALDGAVQRHLEEGLGADLSGVRVHTGSEADDLSRSVQAVAFTTGPDIFFRAGAYQPQSSAGMRLLTHEAAHTVQQAAGPVAGTPAPGGVSVSDPADPFERAADQHATRVAAEDSRAPDDTQTDGARDRAASEGASPGANGLAVQRKEGDDASDGAKAPGVPSFQQMNKPPTAVADLKDLPPRNDIELMGVRLKARQTDFATFLGDAKDDVKNIKGYFKWVTEVYDRSYGHYNLVLQQANGQAETQQAVVDLLFGVAIGVGIGMISEVTLGAWAANTAYELLAEAAAEGVEGGVGYGAGLAGVKPEIAKAKVSDELNPAFKQIQALQQLDQLNTAVLGMSIPGPLVYSNPIVQSERLSAELRVAEAHGERRMSDDDIRQAYLKLMHFDVQSIQMENIIKEQRGKFDALRAAYTGKQAPSDERSEQDIWILWLEKQNPVGSWGGMFASIVGNKLILNHLADIGLAARGTKGGRLNADIEYHNPTLEPGHDDDDTAAWQIVSGAKAAAPGVPAYWADVFLMGSGGKK